MVAMTAISANPLIRTIYEERVGKGMKKMAALGLCMHKILRIIYGMLKNNQAFDPIKPRDRTSKGKDKPRQDKSRRYQDYDPKAPISRRQHLNRMERKQSHSADNGTKIGIIAPVPFPT